MASEPITMTKEQETMCREWAVGFREAPDEMPERAAAWMVSEIDATRSRLAAVESEHAELVRALRPFAGYAPVLDGRFGRECVLPHRHKIGDLGPALVVSEFRRAHDAAALPLASQVPHA